MMRLVFAHLTLACICLGAGAQSPSPDAIASSPPLALETSSTHNNTDDNLQSTPTPQICKETSSPLPLPPKTTTISPEALLEDQETVNKTIEEYGLPKDYTLFELPGPEIWTDHRRRIVPIKVFEGNLTSYTLRIRTITDLFSYNSRYEESKQKLVDDIEVLAIKGQFGEHFKRNSGGFYIRTIGYTLDENGYQQFLIDLTKAEKRILSGSAGGHRKPLSSAALGSLIGGNSLG